MGDLEALAIHRSLRTRLSLTGAVLVAAGLGTALALGASGDDGVPSIDADSSAPLFALRGMQPEHRRSSAASRSAPAAARRRACWSARRWRAGWRPTCAWRSPPARARRRATGIRAPASCPSASCGPARSPTSPPRARPAVDDAPLASGTSRVYRFRVELPERDGRRGGAGHAGHPLDGGARAGARDRGRGARREAGGRCASVRGRLPAADVHRGRAARDAARRAGAADRGRYAARPARQEPDGSRALRDLPGRRAADRRRHAMAVVGRVRAAAPACPHHHDHRHHPARPRPPAVGQREPAGAAVPDGRARGRRRRASAQHAPALRLRPRPVRRDRAPSARRRAGHSERADHRLGRRRHAHVVASCERRAVGPRARPASGGGRPARRREPRGAPSRLPQQRVGGAGPCPVRPCAADHAPGHAAHRITTVRHQLLGRGGGCRVP